MQETKIKDARISHKTKLTGPDATPSITFFILKVSYCHSKNLNKIKDSYHFPKRAAIAWKAIVDKISSGLST